MGDPNHHVCASKTEGKAVNEIIEPDDNLDLHFCKISLLEKILLIWVWHRKTDQKWVLHVVK